MLRGVAASCDSRVRWLVEHRYFTYASSRVIVLNALFIFVDEEHLGEVPRVTTWVDGWGED